MSEHAHLLVCSKLHGYRIAEFLQAVKLPVTRRCIEKLKREEPARLRALEVDGKERGYRFWQAGGGHDSNLFTSRLIMEKAEYCHANPVKRGLVKTADEWKWSSFRWLVMGKREGEPLGIDDWDWGGGGS